MRNDGDFDGDHDAPFDEGWYDRKAGLMAGALGPMHDVVLHSVIPFALGGGLDLYYYPDGKAPGTAVATMELSPSPDEGASNDAFASYEAVMFTRHPLDLDAAEDATTPFGRAHARIQAVLNPIANYACKETLNPGDTCEFPAEMPRVGGQCLVFDEFATLDDDFGLLLVLEVFRSEMEFAREQGSAALFARLKQAGHYPYSDLDRDPVA